MTSSTPSRDDKAPAPEAPDLRTARKLARRRFLGSFRKRLQQRKARRLARRTAGDPSGSSLRPRGRRRKRTAFALGVSAMGLSGTTQFALSSDPISASTNEAADEATGANVLVDPDARFHASKLSVSEELLEAMVEEEGVRYDVYRDVAGYPTVGVGHLVLPQDKLRIGDTISHQRAMDLLEQDLKKAEKGVRDLVGDLPLRQNEFDALVDLVFNVGSGTVGPEKSPDLNSAIKQRDYEAIAAELDYRRAKNMVAKGLVSRSERREQIFLKADYSDPREA